MDDYQDKELLSKTLRASFSGGKFLITKRSQVVEALKDLFDVSQLTAIYKDGNTARVVSQFQD